MAAPARGMTAFRTYLEMIKIEHSIFALPFAMLGMIWGAKTANGNLWPGTAPFLWIVVAMVSCRSAAMAFNRIADRDIDAQNPRTATRALPTGLLQLKTANLYFFASCVIFFVASANLNRLTLLLSPIALAVVLLYSLTKRFTWLCHFVLGLSLGIAPAAAYIGVAGTLSVSIVWMTLAVALWTAGFDIIYSLQDDEFDREMGLQSLPAKFGRSAALMVSRVCHLAAIGFLVIAGLTFPAGVFYFVGVALAAVLLIYEQSLVRTHDLSKVNVAFFTLNGFVSIGVFLLALIDLLV